MEEGARKGRGGARQCACWWRSDVKGGQARVPSSRATDSMTGATTLPVAKSPKRSRAQTHRQRTMMSPTTLGHGGEQAEGGGGCASGRGGGSSSLAVFPGESMEDGALEGVAVEVVALLEDVALDVALNVRCVPFAVVA